MADDLDQPSVSFNGEVFNGEETSTANIIESEDYINILVCSSNVGNKEPTPSSFNAWVPADGDVLGPVRGTKYPVLSPLAMEDFDESNFMNTASGGDGKQAKKFDIIVLGMQEAAFVEKTKKDKTAKRQGSDGNDSPDADISDREGETVGVGETPNLKSSVTSIKSSAASATGGISSHPDGGNNNSSTHSNNPPKSPTSSSGAMHKAPKKFMKQLIKVDMMLRGITASRTYTRNPKLRKTMDQEVNDKINQAVKKLPSSYDSRKLEELIFDQCPSYELVVSFLRGEMRLFILALKDVADEIGDVFIDAENTGIGSVLANKGGIIATLTLRGTRLSFMTAHLEAHEGENHYNNRNKNIAEILAGARTDPDYNLQDASITSHHMFICGDLNYRIKFKEANGAKKEKAKPKSRVSKGLNSLTGSIKSSPLSMRSLLYSHPSTRHASSTHSGTISETNEEEEETPSLPATPKAEESNNSNPANGSYFEQAKAMVEEEKWDELNEGDELAMALRNKDCLTGFSTLPCNWPPTFKVARSEGYVYNEKRTPSYTDRIVWNSTDGMANNVIPFLYEPCPDFITSDHKPIRGAFAVKMNKGPSSQSMQPKNNVTTTQPNENEKQVHLLITDLKCKNLPIMDNELIGGLSDPYVLFVSYPKKLLWDKAWPSTKIISRNLNPVWDEEIHLTLDAKSSKGDGDKPSFSGEMLYLTVMDYDLSSGDDVIGTVALNLKDLCSDIDFTDDIPSPSSTEGPTSRRPTTVGQRASIMANSQRVILSDARKLHESKISRPILRNGQEYGMLECTILSAYLAKGETKGFLRIAKRLGRTKKQSSVMQMKNYVGSFFPGLSL